MMHTLGFDHEQRRPDRDDYVEIQFDNIKKGLQGFLQTENVRKINVFCIPGTEQNFAIKTDMETFGLDYDFQSLMHYDGMAFSNNKNYTIVTKVT